MDPGTNADLAALVKVVARQRAEMARLRDLAATSAVLERAKGVLMAVTGCTAERGPRGTGPARPGRQPHPPRTVLAHPGHPAARTGARRPAGTTARRRIRRECAPPAARTWRRYLGRVGRDLVRVGSPHELAGRLLDHLAPPGGADRGDAVRAAPEGGLRLHR
ncbi:hypothetical protein LT493_08690 [Streptomyces tricolor]|nr:hypothetical protein [Streptomyces tricolor]